MISATRGRMSGAVLLALALVGPADLPGQTPDSIPQYWAESGEAVEASIQGRVTDAKTGKPIVAAQVYLKEAPIGALSGEDGRFEIAAVPAGEWTLIAERIRYGPYQSRVLKRRDRGLVVHVPMTEVRLGFPVHIIGRRDTQAEPGDRPRLPLCDPALGSGVRVVVRDIVSGLAPVVPVELQTSAGGELRGVVAQADYPTSAGVRLASGARHESTGPFEVTVSAPGYHPWAKSGVHLTGLDCRPPASPINYVWLIPM